MKIVVLDGYTLNPGLKLGWNQSSGGNNRIRLDLS